MGGVSGCGYFIFFLSIRLCCCCCCFSFSFSYFKMSKKKFHKMMLKLFKSDFLFWRHYDESGGEETTKISNDRNIFVWVCEWEKKIWIFLRRRKIKKNQQDKFLVFQLFFYWCSIWFFLFVFFSVIFKNDDDNDDGNYCQSKINNTMIGSQNKNQM